LSPNLAFSVVVAVLRRLMFAVASREWTGRERIPDDGCIVVFNHVSHLDPLVTGHFMYDGGTLPRYLVKSSLFRIPVLGRLLVAAGQIPVDRLTVNAVGAYDAAVTAVNEGRTVAVYPEGTLTRDPDLWPMRGKSGAARIALATGAPVIPVGHWGAQELLPPYARRPHLWPRKHLAVKAGDPVDLDDLLGVEVTPEVVQECTDRIMAALVAVVEDLRGEQAPVERFDPRRAGVAQIGNPNRRKKDEDR